MARRLAALFPCLFLILASWSVVPEVRPQVGPAGLDARVQRFLDNHRGSWHDLNVPESDGRVLHDIVVKNRYRRALEIGTSTGHSGIWIGWALSKTGGKLITIDIDKSRHDEAVGHFAEAGLLPYIDARLGDAHEIVPALPGPFDFVFSDADKDWYTNYLKAVLPKLSPGGCFVAHNVSERGRGYSRDFVQYLRGISELQTSFVETGAGMSVSYRK